MNKGALVDRVSDELGMPKQQVQKALDAILEAIQEAVLGGERVTLTGFGTFSRGWRPPRSGRHPGTGRLLNLHPAYYCRFRAGAPLRRALQSLIPRFDTDPAHGAARRVARTLVADLELYHGDLLELASKGRVPAELESLIAEARSRYVERVDREVQSKRPYFDQELWRAVGGARGARALGLKI